MRSTVRSGLFVVLILLLSIGVGCATNPYTHRSQLLMLPESYEMQMGLQAFQQVLHGPKVKISEDPREIEPVQRVAHRIIEAAKRSKYAERAQQFNWEVVVIKDDKIPNAFALPGGKIAVYTGIFPIAKNEAGLAAILGHEVTHALARHGAERMSQGLIAEVTLLGTSVALSSTGMGSLTYRSIMQALGLGAQVGVLLPFSRQHESEADYISLLLAPQAGYDPQEAVGVWERMERASGAQPPEFLSTHPSHGTRIQQLQEWMSEALGYYHQAPRAPVAELPGLKE